MVSDNTYSKSNASPLGSKEGKLHAMSASESLYFLLKDIYMLSRSKIQLGK
ncbi:hypothetical protein [Campylobacter hyointestinalis]|uniref:hypothetical protein n=1 Tax=Campylobacter hyointestinalis TaxID=198 RepID=UPI0014792A72|nr:hypothetical protein [Campylobacter hyointestinalis]QKF70215.1 hypothetical protein CHLWT_1691 [Campylobacter hyointestinalis subsp. lawsonii]